MKTYIFLSLLIMSNILFGQTNKSDGFVDYTFKHHYDTSDLNKSHTEVLRLYYNSNMSIYRSIARLQFDSAKHAELQSASKNNQTSNINFGQLPGGSIEQFFTILNEQKTLVYRKFLRVNYLMPDTTKISWTLQKDTLGILGYKCQKAIGECKGRTYQAWFTTAISYSTGPWKLKGLPGIILKAEDDKNHVSFTAIGINTYHSEVDIFLPENPKYTTQKELMRAIKAYRENPNENQTDGAISIVAKSNNIIKKDTKLNNPVELTN